MLYKNTQHWLGCNFSKTAAPWDPVNLLILLNTNSLMLMSVYFDESGTHAASPVSCVAGYLFDIAVFERAHVDATLRQLAGQDVGDLRQLEVVIGEKRQHALTC